MIGAILWAQWRSMRSFSGRSFFSSITGVLFYGFWLFAAVGAEAFFANPENRALFPTVLSPALLAMILYWQVTPIVTATLGASLDLKKLLVYPIPHERLFLIEVLLRITTCLEMLMVLTGLALGILRNPEIGGLASVPRVAAAAALFASMNLLLSAGFRSLLERWLMRPRLREVWMLLVVSISILPQFLLRSHLDLGRYKNFLSPSVFLPWSAAAHMLLNLEIRNPAIVSVTAAALAYAFGRWQFRAGLRFDGQSSTVRPRGNQTRASWLERLLRFPASLFSDPLAAIIEKETLSLSRMAPFRLIFVMGCALGVLLWLPQAMNTRTPNQGFMSQNILAFATAYGVLMLGQVTYFNCFGFDRSAVQTWFSLPVPIAITLRGKNLAAAFFILLEIGLTTLVTLALRVPVTPMKIAEGFCVSLITALYLISVGNITSTRFPRALNPEKVNQGGAAKASNLMMFFVFPVVLSPVALAYWARSVFDSEAIFFALLALAAVAGCVLYWVAMESATAAALSRRELILTEFSRGDGPISVA